jgi:hypothetical protein
VAVGTPVEGFEQLPGGAGVAVLGAGGARLATARALVGADGWFSGVRARLLADGPPAFKDVVVWRARVARRDDWLPDPSKTKWCAAARGRAPLWGPPHPAGRRRARAGARAESGAAAAPPARRARRWVPHEGMRPGALLAVLIPVPGGDLVWQCHAPIDRLRELGVAFDPATGEAASSHAESAGGAAAAAGGGAKARCLAAFGGLPGAAPFLDVVRATPEGAVTEHGLYQRTPEQVRGARSRSRAR